MRGVDTGHCCPSFKGMSKGVSCFVVDDLSLHCYCFCCCLFLFSSNLVGFAFVCFGATGQFGVKDDTRRQDRQNVLGAFSHLCLQNKKQNKHQFEYFFGWNYQPLAMFVWVLLRLENEPLVALFAKTVYLIVYLFGFWIGWDQPGPLNDSPTNRKTYRD